MTATLRMGASLAPAVLGADPYRTPLDAWRMIVAGDIGPSTETDGNDDDREAATLGHDLEPMLAGWIGERIGAQLVAAQSEHRHPDHPWLVVHPDYLVLGRPAELAEIKTHGLVGRGAERDQWSESENRLPLKVRIQCQVQLAASVRDVAHVGALVAGQGRILCRVERDAEADEVIERLAVWWTTHVVLRVPPPATSLADASWLREATMRAGKLRRVEADDIEAIAKLAAARRALKRAKLLEDVAELEVKTRLGDADALVDTTGELVTWRRQSAFSADLFRQAFPELAAQYDRPRLDLDALKRDHPDKVKLFREPGRLDSLRLAARAESYVPTLMPTPTPTP